MIWPAMFAEWVADWYDVYPGGDASVSRYFGQTRRVLRGGAWFSDYSNMRVFRRHSNVPSYSNDNFGFRCARDAE